MHRISNISPDAATGDCAVCGTGVPLRFRRHRKQWACKTSDGRRGPNHDRQRRDVYLKQFGMTSADYEQLLADQNGVCAICQGVTVDGRALAVDHCHHTGRVRGLLCQRCNTALGLMKDDPERLLRAVRYITPLG